MFLKSDFFFMSFCVKNQPTKTHKKIPQQQQNPWVKTCKFSREHAWLDEMFRRKSFQGGKVERRV